VVHSPDFSPRMLTRKLETILVLTDPERAAVSALPAHIVPLKRNHDIVREGDRPGRCCVLVEGMACWSKTGSDGTRQILGLHIPGDVPDLQSLHLNVMDASLMTLSRCEVAFIPHEPIRQLCTDYPRLGAALWRWSLVDAAMFREWVMNLGGRQALGRIAHLLCEIFARLKHIGLAEDNTCGMPMTQGEIGDATGLSAVHVNRVLQSLRAQALISLRGNILTVHDWPALQAAADFDTTYLHLGQNGSTHLTLA
jgi:CRP-like cAMP-binding protein